MGDECGNSIYSSTEIYEEFVDAEDMFTLSFFKEDYRKALNLCGSKSGRDCDKEKEAGLTPYYTDGTTAYEEADLIFVCKKALCTGDETGVLYSRRTG